MKLDEVAKWTPFVHEGKIYDLSHLDAHKITYTHSVQGKADIVYEFWVTYSFHCFAKNYPGQCPIEQESLMYSAPKDERPFCFTRYELSHNHMKNIINKHKGKITVESEVGKGTRFTILLPNY